MTKLTPNIFFMKRTKILFSLILSATMLMPATACSSGNKTSGTAAENSAADSAQAAAQTDTAAASPNGEEQQATAAPDLVYNDLRGHVKTATLWFDETENNHYTLTFSPEGKWLTIDGKKLAAHYNDGVKRDSEGRIISLNSSEPDSGIIEETEATWADGRVVKRAISFGMDGFDTETYTYDTRGNLTACKTVSEDPMDEEAEPTTYTTAYTILATDAQGNWTRRRMKVSTGVTIVQKRTITYY